jgi:hypothetical protein
VLGSNILRVPVINMCNNKRCINAYLDFDTFLISGIVGNLSPIHMYVYLKLKCDPANMLRELEVIHGHN